MLVAAVAVAAACSFTNASPLGVTDARHLLARTGFGPTRAEIEAYAPFTREQAVDRLLADVRTTPTTPTPQFGPLLPRNEMTAEAKVQVRAERIDEAIELKTWWANELLSTSSPFTEHLVLFWSNHFTSSIQKVKAPQLLYEQNALFRSEGSDNFATLLKHVVDDRAMLLYLDGAKNQAGAPNENFARELLELFTLGEGHYSERDVQEAARALTGTTVKRNTGAVATPYFRHDRGEKTFLGVTGDLDSADVVDVLLKQPRTAEFVVEKLWREFVSPAPDSGEVARLAAVLRTNNYAMKPLLRALLLSPAFWAPSNRGVLVKSPIDLVVGASRSLELVGTKDAPTPVYVVRTCRELGQDLFDPPNVKGWPGGDRWITTMTLPERERIARDAVAAARIREQPHNEVRLATLLLPLPPVDGDSDLESIARDPAFQLK